MGKNRHSKDRLFVTQTEHKYLYGGKKAEIRRAYRRLPFNCCAITLSPFKNPVCTREGHLFDLEAVVPYVKQHQINPVTGAPLTLKELIRLTFSRNAQHELFCPVTYKVFTDNSKIAAIATTGNVFAYEAIEELNIKPKNWTDLLTGAAFKRKDIIILQDPHDLSTREIENFEHLRRAKALDQKAQPETIVKNIRTTAATDRILQELEATRAAQKELIDKIQRGDDVGVSAKDKIVASLTHSKPTQHAAAVTAAAATTDNNAKIQYSQFTAGDVSRSFTSSAMTPMTINASAIATQRETLERRWRIIRRMKQKALVRLTTTLGDLNLEIHCDFVPETADNFVSLCRTHYYDNVSFHRLIKGFMLQGGDPTGTGRGGESIWKLPFRDEIDSRLSHDKRGVVSMANAGPGTNRSQFFITFAACTHLDKKHAVFGHVVGGFDVLDRIERLSVDGDDRPFDDVRILKTDVFNDPFQELEEAEAQGKDVQEVAHAKRASEARAKVQGTVVKVGNDWIAYDNSDGGLDALVAPLGVSTDACTKDESVGKYLQQQQVTKKRRHAAAEESAKEVIVDSKTATVPSAIESKKKSKVTSSSGFGNFAGW